MHRTEKSNCLKERPISTEQRIAAVCRDRDALQTARHRRRHREAALVTVAKGAQVGERGRLVAVFLFC